MFRVFVLLFCLPWMVLSFPTFNKIPLPMTGSGPESIAFELNGAAFYTGIADGRILKYQFSDGFSDFAFTTPTRSRAVCDGTTDLDLGPTCGRPFGLALNYANGQLYVADAYSGLLSAGPNGRLATQLATSAEGVPFRFLNGLDIDQITGIVYFTDFSSVNDFRTIVKLNTANDNTGRLLKYDPSTNQVTVLLRNLGGASGVALSEDRAFVLVSEFLANRTRKYWLKGPRANTYDIINLQGRPNNIKRSTPLLFARQSFWQTGINSAGTPVGQRIDENGVVLETLSFESLYGTAPLSEVQPFGGALFISSPFVNFVGFYRP